MDAVNVPVHESRLTTHVHVWRFSGGDGQDVDNAQWRNHLFRRLVHGVPAVAGWITGGLCGKPKIHPTAKTFAYELSNRGLAPFACANAKHVAHIGDNDLSIADLSRLVDFDDRLHHGIGLLIGDNDGSRRFGT